MSLTVSEFFKASSTVSKLLDSKHLIKKSYMSIKELKEQPTTISIVKASDPKLVLLPPKKEKTR